MTLNSLATQTIPTIISAPPKFCTHSSCIITDVSSFVWIKLSKVAVLVMIPLFGYLYAVLNFARWRLTWMKIGSNIPKLKILLRKHQSKKNNLLVQISIHKNCENKKSLYSGIFQGKETSLLIYTTNLEKEIDNFQTEDVSQGTKIYQ